MSDVVITGYGAITPIGLGVEAFADGLKSGACGVGTIDLFDASAYRSSLAGQIRGDIRTEAVRERAAAAGVPLQTRYGLSLIHI